MEPSLIWGDCRLSLSRIGGVNDRDGDIKRLYFPQLWISISRTISFLQIQELSTMSPLESTDTNHDTKHDDDKPQSDSFHVEVLKPQADIDDIESTGTGRFIWLVACTASIGGMLFGYDTGIISAVLVYLYEDLGHALSPSEKEMVTALCSAGAFVGSVIAGLTADQYGRKSAIYVGCALFTIGAVIQGAAYSIAQMAVGRLVVGFGVGSAAMIVPMYIAELAPTKHRGRMIGLNNVSITGGQVISYGIGAAFANVPHGWRYMVGLGGIPSIILAICLPFCPESPRQLIYHDKHDEARHILQRIFRNATPEQVALKVQQIEDAVQEARSFNEGRSRFQMIKQLHTNPAYFRALVCACGLSMFPPSLLLIDANLSSGGIANVRLQHPHVLLVHSLFHRRILQPCGCWSRRRWYESGHDIRQYDGR